MSREQKLCDLERHCFFEQHLHSRRPPIVFTRSSSHLAWLTDLDHFAERAAQARFDAIAQIGCVEKLGWFGP